MQFSLHSHPGQYSRRTATPSSNVSEGPGQLHAVATVGALEPTGLARGWLQGVFTTQQAKPPSQVPSCCLELSPLIS